MKSITGTANNFNPNLNIPAPDADKILLSANRGYIGKPPKSLLDSDSFWRDYNGDFKPFTGTIHEVADLVFQGWAISAHVRGYRKAGNFISRQEIGLDFDTKDERSSLDYLAAHTPRFERLLYTSASHTPDQPKARVIYPLDQPVTDVNEYRDMVLAFYDFLGLDLDQQCKDPARLWFGSKGCEYRILNEGQRLSVDWLRELVASYKQRREAARSAFAHQPRAAGSDTHQIVDILHGMALDRAGSGRNAAGFWLAGQLRDHGISESEALRIGLDYQHTVALSGDHEYTEREIEASVKQAYRQAARDPWITVSVQAADILTTLSTSEPAPAAESEQPEHWHLSEELHHKLLNLGSPFVFPLGAGEKFLCVTLDGQTKALLPDTAPLMMLLTRWIDAIQRGELASNIGLTSVQ